MGSMTFSPDPPTNVYAYVGSTLTKDFYQNSTGPVNVPTCSWFSSITVQNPSGVYISESDSYFGKIIDSSTPASGNTDKTVIKFMPLI